LVQEIAIKIPANIKTKYLIFLFISCCSFTFLIA
jgi:hypothetical protein